jgi:uncharacterized protein YukE
LSQLAPAAADILGLVAYLRAALDHVRSLGPPHRLAGDPAAMRRVALGWRRMGQVLRSTAAHLDARVTATVPSSWEDDAARAAQASWRRLRAEIEQRAAGYEQVAASLEAAAGRAERLNADVERVTGEISRVASTAESLARQALGLAMLAELLQQAAGLRGALQEALVGVGRFQQGLIGELHQDLRFSFHGGNPVRVSLTPISLSMPGGRLGLGLALGRNGEWTLPGLRLGVPGIANSSTTRPGNGSSGGLLVGIGVLLLGALALLSQLPKGGGAGDGGGSGGGSGTQDQTHTDAYSYQQWQTRVNDNLRYFGYSATGQPPHSPPPSPPARNPRNYLNLNWLKEQLRLRTVANQEAQRLGVSPQRLEQLSYDPDQSGLTENSVQNEASAAVRAERDHFDGLKPGDLQRGSSPGNPDYVGNGKGYEVKTPDSNSNFTDSRGTSWLNDIQNDIASGRRVIFNIRNLNAKQLGELHQQVAARGWSGRVGYVNG